jgi:hypothetical protein
MIWTNRKFLSNPKPVPDDGPIIAYRKLVRTLLAAGLPPRHRYR